MWFCVVAGVAGSARLSTLSSAWFCQKQTANAITSAIAQMISRVRSSSRWSTTLRRSSWLMGRRTCAT